MEGPDFGRTGLNNWVRGIVVRGTDIYVCGDLSNAGANPRADHIARSDGSGWRSFGAGLDLAVLMIAVTEDDVCAGGWFEDAGGDPDADYVARWGKVVVRRHIHMPLAVRSG